MDRDYPVVVLRLSEEDGGGYLAYAPDLPGCMSDADTPEGALVSLKGAVSEWISEQSERGEAVPEPGDAARRASEWETKMLEAMQALIEYRQGADEKIAKLERKLAELIALSRDDMGRPRVSLSSRPGDIRREVRVKH